MFFSHRFKCARWDGSRRSLMPSFLHHAFISSFTNSAPPSHIIFLILWAGYSRIARLHTFSWLHWLLNERDRVSARLRTSTVRYSVLTTRKKNSILLRHVDEDKLTKMVRHGSSLNAPIAVFLTVMLSDHILIYHDPCRFHKVKEVQTSSRAMRCFMPELHQAEWHRYVHHWHEL